MVDTVDRVTRSRIMRAIKSEGSLSTERRFGALLARSGISGWHFHVLLPGKPDIVFGKRKIAIFLDGCFWHGCFSCYRRPNSRRAYWDRKVQANRIRDKQITSQLTSQGWRVLRFWEHEVRDDSNRCMQLLLRKLNSKDLRASRPQILT